MRKSLYLSLVLVLMFFLGCALVKSGTPRHVSISPYSYGLSKAKNGEERFRVLYNTHLAAVAAGGNVDYSGIKRIDLEIPNDAKSIPLTVVNDFAGVEFHVKNTKKDFFLFSYAVKSTPVMVSKQDVDRGDFRHYPDLNKGRKLLVVSDDNPWVLNREGYNYGHVRKDILLLKNGVAQNRTIMPYNNNYSSPSCAFIPVNKEGMMVSHITLHRTESSTQKTFLLSINGVDGLTLEDITIHTPENHEVKDKAITIMECTNVTFKNVTIDGTYSQTEHSGYGVSLNNIWNFKVCNMYGHGDWGVFGTNNVNVASFEDSDINRFDIHCYGRDISFKNVTFRDKYNQFASVYGTIQFDSCEFIHFCPINNGPSYNAYVGYDIIMNNCTFNACFGKTVLFNCGRLDNKANVRQELSERCLPNISINNLTVSIDDDIPNIYLLYVKTDDNNPFRREIGYISDIFISGVKFIYKKERAPGSFYLSNVKLSIERPVNRVLENIDLIGNSKGSKRSYGSIFDKLELRSPASTKRVANVKAISVEE